MDNLSVNLLFDDDGERTREKGGCNKKKKTGVVYHTDERWSQRDARVPIKIMIFMDRSARAAGPRFCGVIKAFPYFGGKRIIVHPELGLLVAPMCLCLGDSSDICYNNNNSADT